MYMKENLNTDCVVNVKSAEISYELDQNLSGLQIYPNVVKNSESVSLAAKRSSRISWKVDFSVLRYPNIPLGLITMGKMFASSTLPYKSCVLYHCLEIIFTNFDHLSKE